MKLYKSSVNKNSRYGIQLEKPNFSLVLALSSEILGFYICSYALIFYITDGLIS